MLTAGAERKTDIGGNLLNSAFYEGQVPCPVFEYCDFDVLKMNRQTKFNYMKVFLLQKHGP